ncbi:MAG: hypothetical protein ACRDPC_26005 [Solirubrobacteraceae bacterium]
MIPAIATREGGWSVAAFYGVAFLAIVTGCLIGLSRELRRGR